jgi:hypothetical protein
MFDSLVSSIENAFVQFSFRRLVYMIFLFAVVISTCVVLNELTGYTLYSRMEKKISALERLQELREKGVEQSMELNPIYQSVVGDIQQKPWEQVSIHFTFDPVIKFLSATLVPFLFIFIGFFNILRGDEAVSRTVAGAMLLTILLGLPAVLIPTWQNPWYNASVYFIIQIILMFLMLKYSSSLKQT